MKNKLLICLIFLSLIIFTGFSSAQIQDYGSHPQNTNITLIQTCDNCTYVNITAIILGNLEDGDEVIFNEAMTQNGVFFSFNLNDSYTMFLGNYYIIGEGDPDGVITSFIYSFVVTPSGSQVNTGLSIPILLPIVITFVLAFIFFFISSRMNRVEYMWTFIIFGSLSLLFSIIFGIMASRESLWGFPILYNFITSIYRIFIAFLPWIAIIVVVTVMFYVVKKTFSAKGYNIQVGGKK